MKRPIVLYHGTSSSRLKVILREGLKPRRSNAKRRRTWRWSAEGSG